MNALKEILSYSGTIMQKIAAIQIYKDFSLSNDWN